jgi:hypothetical protein
MGEACSMSGRDEKWLQNFVGEPGGEEISPKIILEWMLGK